MGSEWGLKLLKKLHISCNKTKCEQLYQDKFVSKRFKMYYDAKSEVFLFCDLFAGMPYPPPPVASKTNFLDPPALAAPDNWFRTDKVYLQKKFL